MKIDLTYHYLTHHIVPGPQSLSYFIPLLLLPAALLIPRTVLSRWQNACIFLPIMTLSTAHAWYIMNGTDVISADVLFQAIFFLVFHDPWTRYEYVAPPPPSEQAENAAGRSLDKTHEEDQDDADADETSLLHPISSKDTTKQPEGQRYPSSLRSRALWVLTLLSSIRLNNWRIGHRGHDVRQPPPPAFRTRKAFLAQSIISFTRGYIVLDLTRAYISHDAYFTDTSIPISSPLPFGGLMAAIPPQLLRSMILGAQAWSLISQLAYLAFLIPVGLSGIGLIPNSWSPHTWVPFFGSARIIFSSGVRGFWGGYWHQTMRWMTSGPGYALSDALTLRERSLWRYALIAVSAFGLSGVTHMGLVPPEPLNASVSANAIRMYVAAFFWVQPVSMVAEVLIVKMATRLLPVSFLMSRQAVALRAVVNGSWVVLWFTLCIPLLGEAGRQLGYWRMWPIPISLWKGLSGEGWVAWPFLLE